MRVLIIQGNTIDSSELCAGLAAAGFHVDVHADAMHGTRDADGAVDTILIDHPGHTGGRIPILEKMRADGDDTPVIVLSAISEVADRITALEHGADGFLVKPIAVEELAAHIRAIMRRARCGTIRGGLAQETLQIADLEVDLSRHRAYRAGGKLNLTPKEFALLSLFARRSGEVLNRATIAEHVWDTKLDGATNVVDVHVRRLRAKLDEPFGRRLIHTVRGTGYVLEVRPQSMPTSAPRSE